jgi:hypothetical protein
LAALKHKREVDRETQTTSSGFPQVIDTKLGISTDAAHRAVPLFGSPGPSNLFMVLNTRAV